VNQEISFKVVARDPSLVPGVVFNYQLAGAPFGSYIDPSTGAFDWIPGQAGQYTFYVVVTDNSDQPRFATTQVSITVNPALQVFGSDFFQGARALIDFRLTILRVGIQPLGVQPPPSSSQNQYPAPNPGALPLITTLGQAAQYGLYPGGGMPGQYNPNQMGGNPGGSGQGQSPYSPYNPFNNLPSNSPFSGSIPGNNSPYSNPNNPSSNSPYYIPSSPTNGTNGNNQNGNQQGNQNNQQNQGNGSGNNGSNNGSGNNSQSNPNQFGNGNNNGNGNGSSNGFGPQFPQNGGGFQQNQFPGQMQGQGQFPATPPTPYSPGFGTFTPLTKGLFGQSPTTSNLYNPYPTLNPQEGGNSFSADAGRYPVGPFDMFSNVYVPAPERYQLGPGDLLTITYWSPSLPATVLDAKVDPLGNITIPSNGRKLQVRGKTLADAERMLKRAVGLDIKEADLTLALKALRTMSISVLGEAYMPGNYQVPAVMTFFNALYMFGGPNDNGSYRNVELHHNDGTVRHMDIYKYLVEHDASQDVPLQPGDTIWIPAASVRVSLKGEVLHPAIYEATPKDGLKDLIHFAGGTRATGVDQRVSLETVSPGQSRQLRDVDLKSTGPDANPPVYDGDLATVFSVRDELMNRITLDGDVNQPGDYAYYAGETVADIINKAQGLQRDAVHKRADLYRQNPDKTTVLIPLDLDRALSRQGDANLALKPFDRIRVYAEQDVQWMGDRHVTVIGAVQKPGQFERSDNMRIFDLLLQAGGLAPNAFKQRGYLQRTNPDGTNGPLIPVDFNRLVTGDQSQNVEIMDKDVLTIQTIPDANFVPDQTVQILGAVQAPGAYPRSSNMKLSDLLHIAGGPQPNAQHTVEIAHSRVPFDAPRVKVRLDDVLAGVPGADVVMQDGDLVTLAEDSSIQLQTAKVIIMGSVNSPGTYAINGKTDRLSELIGRAGGFAPDAFPEGVEFYRDPKRLWTDIQQKVEPRIMQALSNTAQDEYNRAVAASEVDKANALKGVNSASNISLPGLPSQTETSANVPASLFNNTPVTAARLLNSDDLVPTGDVNVRLPEAMRHKKGPDDLVLKDGDIVVIPEQPKTVSVVGAVIVPSAVLFKPGVTVGYYIRNAGGYSVDAAKDRILVLRYGGLVTHANERTRLQVGDIIWVPTKVMSERLTQKASAVDTITKTVTTGAILLAVLRAIVR
jgi:protein involved in polysaccharide export with SLBB domain